MEEDTALNLTAAKWLQLQAQLALRLQSQQMEATTTKKEESPLDLSSLNQNSKACPPAPFVSFASLMMESWSNASPGMTALQKISQLAQQRTQATQHQRFNPVNQSSFPMLNLPFKPNTTGHQTWPSK